MVPGRCPALIPMPKKTVSGLGKRIAQAREAAGITSHAQLARVLGVTRSTVSQWESEITSPASAKLRKIAIETGVDSDWLATGRGKIFVDDAGSLSVNDFDDTPARPKSGILEIDVRAGLGGGGTMDDREVRHDGIYADPIKDESWRFPARFMREEMRISANRAIIIETSGDSMAPTIMSGDRVIVDTGHRLPSPDGIYAIRDRYGTIIVKRLQVLRRGDPPVLRIISDNRAHDPEDVGADEIAIVGKVIWGFKRL